MKNQTIHWNLLRSCTQSASAVLIGLNQPVAGPPFARGRQSVFVFLLSQARLL